MFSALRLALRRLRRAPSFTLLSAVTIAVGIGANTAIFSVVDAVLLRPLPYPDADRVIEVGHAAPGIDLDDVGSCASMYLLYRDESRAFSASGLWGQGRSSVRSLRDPEQVDTMRVTHGTLDALGVAPQIGRWFTPEDDSPSSPRTTILSYGYWQDRFGGEPSIVGQSLVVDGEPREIIGVMPRGFRIADHAAELFLPIRIDSSAVRLGQFSYHGVARLAPGVSIEQASADVTRMIPLLWERFAPPPGFNLQMFRQAGFAAKLRPLKQEVVGEIEKILWVLMGAIGMVLLIACANVANLLLVRAEGRRQELTIRAALGAGWSRIARDLLTESLALAALGGALGVPLAYGALQLLVRLGPAGFPRLEEIGLDAAALTFSIVLSLISGLLFGLIPVLQYASPRIAEALRSGGRTMSQGRDRQRTRAALVVAQVALALVLMVASGLMIRTFQALRDVFPGFTDPETVQTLRVPIPASEAESAEQVAAVQRRIVDSLAALPGVDAVGLSRSITLDGSDSWDPIFIEGRSYQEGEVPPLRYFRYVGPNYHLTIGQPLLAGRAIDWTDLDQRRDVVMVSENFALENWDSAAEALGKRVRDNAADNWREIVGVVADERADGLEQDAPVMIYWPLVVSHNAGPDSVRRSALFTLRTPRAGAQSLVNEVRDAVWSVNRNLPIAEVRTLGEIYERALGRTSFTLILLALAGGMALLLGLVGIYGVISYAVSQRSREIGIRMALGARGGHVKGMFVRHGLALTGIGLAVGLLSAAGLMQLLSKILFEVEPFDPLTYAVVAGCLAVAAAGAAYMPARRATAVDPMEALRAE